MKSFIKRSKKIFDSQKTAPAFRYIFFVIANIVKESAEMFAIAITKKDATAIGARITGSFSFEKIPIFCEI